MWRPFVSSPVRWWPFPEVSTHFAAAVQTPVALALLAARGGPGQGAGPAAGPVARVWLGPTEATRLAQRVERLKQTRTDVTVTQAAELRRIERDLHDGTQARLVAMGMKLGAVEALVDTDPVAAKRLAARSGRPPPRRSRAARPHPGHPPAGAGRARPADAVRALALDSPLKGGHGHRAGRLE